MKLELVQDENCLSNEMLSDMRDRLELVIPGIQVEILNFNAVSEKLYKLGLKILPVWLFDNQIIPVNPFDFHALLKFIVKDRKVEEDDINYNPYIE